MVDATESPTQGVSWPLGGAGEERRRGLMRRCCSPDAKRTLGSGPRHARSRIREREVVASTIYARPTTLAAAEPHREDARVLVFLILGNAPILLLLTLAVALYLTVIELRDMQPPPHYTWWIWWLLLVFMTHFIGYLFLRAYGLYRRWNASSG
jgi:hypothetical protein